MRSPVALLLGCVFGLAMSTSAFAEFPDRWSLDSSDGRSNNVLRWLLQRVKKLEAQVAALQEAVTALEVEVTALEARTTASEERLAVLEGRATALENRTTGLDDRVTALEAAQLAVFDANDNLIGKVVGIERGVQGGIQFVAPESRVWIPFHIAGYTFALQVTPTRFIGTIDGIRDTTGEPGVVFETTDCSGPPFMAQETLAIAPPSVLPITQISGPGNTVYIQQPGAASMPVHSVLNVLGQCHPPSFGSGGITRVFPALPLIDLDTLFTAPFSVRRVIHPHAYWR